jgi:hypothetical protein
MKGTIIGTDLLEQGEITKILEINTNVTIFNDGADLLDYDTFFTVLTGNSITELHFIWTESTSYIPINIGGYRFEQKLMEKCAIHNISYSGYTVPANSVTVPYIEDADHKFILRQSYDTTALVDETYCADKFEFFNLMSGSTYSPQTYFDDGVNLSMNTLTSVDLSNTGEPNVVEKNRYPDYDPKIFPKLYVMGGDSELETAKTGLTQSNLLQEFIYDDANVVDGYWSVMRSIDIIYGPELDVVNMGGYRQSAIIPANFATNEFIDGTNVLNQKTRYKYINKQLGNFSSVDYHVDDDTSILKYDGTLTDINQIQLGDFIKSIDFTDLNGTSPSDGESITAFGWDGTLAKTVETMVDVQSTLVDMVSAQAGTFFIRITLSNGLTWTDAPSCTYYIEESGSTKTRWEKVNNFFIGDKLIIKDSATGQLSALAITGLDIEYGEKTIYGLDFEPSDLFLVDIGDGLFSVMHNSCWCCYNYCGHWCCSSWCAPCDQPINKL